MGRNTCRGDITHGYFIIIREATRRESKPGKDETMKHSGKKKIDLIAFNWILMGNRHTRDNKTGERSKITKQSQSRTRTKTKACGG